MLVVVPEYNALWFLQASHTTEFRNANNSMRKIYFRPKVQTPGNSEFPIMENRDPRLFKLGPACNSKWRKPARLPSSRHPYLGTFVPSYPDCNPDVPNGQRSRAEELPARSLEVNRASSNISTSRRQ